MKRMMSLLACAALLLSACTPLGRPQTAPAPLAGTTIDDSALFTAWKAFDIVLDAVNMAGDAGWIVPGSPKGKTVAAAILKVNAALGAAERFAAAGSTTDYLIALAQAKEGLTELRVAFGGK